MKLLGLIGQSNKGCQTPGKKQAKATLASFTAENRDSKPLLTLARRSLPKTACSGRGKVMMKACWGGGYVSFVGVPCPGFAFAHECWAQSASTDERDQAMQ